MSTVGIGWFDGKSTERLRKRKVGLVVEEEVWVVCWWGFREGEGRRTV